MSTSICPAISAAKWRQMRPASSRNTPSNKCSSWVSTQSSALKTRWINGSHGKLSLKEGFLAVLPDGAPKLLTDKKSYEPGDTLRANCTSLPSRPAAVLLFSLNNIAVSILGTTHFANWENLSPAIIWGVNNLRIERVNFNMSKNDCKSNIVLLIQRTCCSV